MSETLPPLGIRRVKVVALAVTELERANRFYKEKLGLEPAFEGAEQVGWWLGQVILMLKPNWAAPTALPNPRITLATDHAPATQAALRARDIVIADEVQIYGDFYVGSFLLVVRASAFAGGAGHACGHAIQGIAKNPGLRHQQHANDGVSPGRVAGACLATGYVGGSALRSGWRQA